MNSFRAVERAIAFEIDRQAAAIDAGEPIVQETRGWSEERGSTYRMRVKETSDDYRYFPEPDLPPLHLSPAWLDGLRAGLPELPAARRTRYRDDLGLSPYDAAVLVADPAAAALFEATLAADPALEPKPVANWVIGEYLRLRNAAGPEGVAVQPAELAAIVGAVASGSISRAQGREVLEAHAIVGRDGRRDHRGARLPPDLGQRGARRRGRRRPGGEPGGRRRLPRRQGAGDRLPRRPGDEGNARAGQRRAGQGRGRASGSRIGKGRAERVGPLNIALWLGGVALMVIGYSRARAPWARYQDAEGPGRQRRPLRILARRRPRTTGRPARPWRWPCSAGRPRSAPRSRSSASSWCSSGSSSADVWRGAGDGRRPFYRGPLSRPANSTRRHSIAVQRSITTSSPPSCAIRAASQSTTPSWSHRQRASAATASRACGAHSPGRRKTSTRSNGPVAVTASASVE